MEIKNIQKPKNGFTLIEILIYLAVLAIIILVVSNFFLWTVRSEAKSGAIREVSDSSRRAIEIMTNEMREAKSIYYPTAILDSHPGQLSLETTKHFPEGENKSYVDFYLCDDQLCFKQESQDPITLTSDLVEITSLIFKEISTTSTVPSVQIQLRVEYKSPSNKPEYNAFLNTTSTVSLRAY